MPPPDSSHNYSSTRELCCAAGTVLVEDYTGCVYWLVEKLLVESVGLCSLCAGISADAKPRPMFGNVTSQNDKGLRAKGVNVQIINIATVA